jgi:hypothetical protein
MVDALAIDPRLTDFGGAGPPIEPLLPKRTRLCR